MQLMLQLDAVCCPVLLVCEMTNDDYSDYNWQLGLHWIWFFSILARAGFGIADPAGAEAGAECSCWSSYVQRSFAIVYIYKQKRGCEYDPHARDEIERCKLPNFWNNEFLHNYTVRQMHWKMVKSDLISGGHIRPGPDSKIRLDFGQGRIWYPVQPY